MNIHTVDLYERYGIPRNGASGGFLTAFIRTESAEIKKRIRPSVLIIQCILRYNKKATYGTQSYLENRADKGLYRCCRG